MDRRRTSIKLRDGVQFHNGEKFDAEGVKYSLERHLNASGSFRRSEIGAMDHVEVVDPLTVRVVMKQAFSPFVAILTDRAGMMVPPRAAEAGGKEFGLHPVCTGPFRFVERVAQDHITLSASPATGTRRASTTTGSPTASFPTAASVWPIFRRARST